MAKPPAPPAADRPRLASVDAYRGFVMLLMLFEMMHLPEVARHFPDSPGWRLVAAHTEHVDWTGCSLHDLIQPSFTFLVGVALTLSLAHRKAANPWLDLLRAAWRAAALTLLGIALRSLHGTHTNFTFEDTLTQIGLGYLPLYLVSRLKPVWWWAALGVVLVGYWAAFALYPAPGPDFDYPAVGVPPDWPHHFTGFASHWNKNSNPAWAFDTWFLNLFPRERPFLFNGGGYATLSFVPTLGTMLVGLLAGHWLKAGGAAWRVPAGLVLAAAAGLTAGWLLGELGACPVVKRIWTPGWVLFSGGWCCLLLAVFHLLTDASGYAGWSYPLRAVGANSILAYVAAKLHVEEFVQRQFRTHLGANVFRVFGPECEPAVGGGVAVLLCVLAAAWLYRRRVFIRI